MLDGMNAGGSRAVYVVSFGNVSISTVSGNDVVLV